MDYTKSDIELLAYKIYKSRQRSGIPGDDISDWFEAERWLRYQETMGIWQRGSVGE